jgi:hypothetical protein
MHEKLMTMIEQIVDKNLTGVMSLDSVSKNGLISLVNVNPLATLAEVAHQASIVKDPSASARDKQLAQTTLRLMAAGSKTITGITRSRAEANAQKASAVKVIELSNKIAALSLSPSAKKFMQAYERALREGKNAEEAVKVASNGKFTEKELRECE